jgi:hypothetical protein
MLSLDAPGKLQTGSIAEIGEDILLHPAKAYRPERRNASSSTLRVRKTGISYS